ncbi:hypothetical protein IQ07DRAFT_169348 [Pyrenochaeta sp. DS3sAY3a]|nr:hypothetical protein IQ07DRAFT_169348 [Pyrenochaeta sp. DS3sAY3a]
MSRIIDNVARRLSTLRIAPQASSTSSNIGNAQMTLVNIRKLRTSIEMTDKEIAWFTEVNLAVRNHINGPAQEDSEAYQHVQRVVKQAYELWTAEKSHSWAKGIDPLTVLVAAMVCNIEAEAKDWATNGSFPTAEAEQECQINMIRELLNKANCPPAVAGPAAHVASRVSFVREMNDRQTIRQDCDTYPTLRIVQDAARLAEMGPLAIAEIFHHGCEGTTAYPNEFTAALAVLDDRANFYPEWMKTKTGMKEAKKRAEYMRKYKEELQNQMDCSDFLESM